MAIQSAFPPTAIARLVELERRALHAHDVADAADLDVEAEICRLGEEIGTKAALHLAARVLAVVTGD
jgi:hypothetical protein